MATVFLEGPLESRMSRRTSTLPLPGAELERLRSTLAHQYGAQVWDGAGERILVVRVPRPEPDVVNDIEAAIEHLTPVDTNGITAALLVGHDKALAVPVHPFGDLMAQRVRFDHEQCTQLRGRLAPGAHLTYRAPGDARKVLRLALRLGLPSVQDLGDDQLDAWHALLGADLEAGRLNGVRAVYLIAEKDEVRLDASMFFHDLRKHAADAKARHELAAQLAARQAPAAPVVGAAKPARVAYAPLRSIEDAPTDAARARHAPVPDARAAPVARTAPSLADAQAAMAAAEEDGDATVATPGLPMALTMLQGHLQELGFDVIVRPPGHRLDLAAERPDGDPQRIVAWTPDRLTPDLAQTALATVRRLDVDLGLIVCDDAEPEGRKRLIATKVRWIQGKDIASLDL